MANTSDGDEESGGGHDKTSSEVGINTRLGIAMVKCGFEWVKHMAGCGFAKWAHFTPFLVKSLLTSHPLPNLIINYSIHSSPLYIGGF